MIPLVELNSNLIRIISSIVASDYLIFIFEYYTIEDALSLSINLFFVTMKLHR